MDLDFYYKTGVIKSIQATSEALDVIIKTVDKPTVKQIDLKKLCDEKIELIKKETDTKIISDIVEDFITKTKEINM
jgi:hypothetical protein